MQLGAMTGTRRHDKRPASKWALQVNSSVNFHVNPPQRLSPPNIVILQNRVNQIQERTYSINPKFVAKSKVQIPTSLKTIEPYRLKALIKEDLRFHPNSLLSEIAQRLPDVEFHELEKMTREMAKNSELNTCGGRKYRRYSLP